MKSMKTSLQIVLVIVLVCGVGWTSSNGQEASKAFGMRAGYGTNPDQFVVGAQAVLGKTLGFMRFAPSVDAGFGDDMTTFLLNADFRLLSFSPPKSPAGLYVGVGGALAVLDAKSAGSDTEVGLNIVTGLTFPMGRKNEYNLEVRFGLADMPDMRILFGVMLGGRARSSSQTIEIRR